MLELLRVYAEVHVGVGEVAGSQLCPPAVRVFARVVRLLPREALRFHKVLGVVDHLAHPWEHDALGRLRT